MGAVGQARHERAVEDAFSPFIVCAFYTDGYVKEAGNLKSSLEAHQLDFDLRRYPSRGIWEANTRIKPEFLYDCLEKYQDRDVVYIDADAVVRQPLTLFEDFKSDLGVFIAPENEGFSHKYLTGTLYLRNTEKTKAFIQTWIKEQTGMILGVDQDSFGRAISLHPDLTVQALPVTYTKIYDRGSETPVIEHFQGSRSRVKLERLCKKVRNVTFGVMIISCAIWLFGNG